MPNKIVYVPAGTAKAYLVFGDVFRFLVTGEESGGSYATMEVIVSPDGGPGPHIHEKEDEQFYVLEGELTYQVGGQTIHASTGDFIHIPRGTIHSFVNGNTPSKLLATFSPSSAEMEFHAAAQPIDNDPLS